jgi:hypothetical protein
MTDIIDKDATVIGDTQRAMFALIEENKALRTQIDAMRRSKYHQMGACCCTYCGLAGWTPTLPPPPLGVCACGCEIDSHDDSGCVKDGCDCRRYKP